MRMNKNIFIFFLLIFAVLMQSGCTQEDQQEQPVDLPVYSGEGFTVSYPEGWTAQDGLLSDPAGDNRFIAVTSMPMAEEEVGPYIDGEIARILAGTEASNSIADPLSSEALGESTLYTFTHLSKSDGAEHVILHAYIFDGDRLHNFHAQQPPIAPEEFDTVIHSFSKNAS